MSDLGSPDGPTLGQLPATGPDPLPAGTHALPVDADASAAAETATAPGAPTPVDTADTVTPVPSSPRAPAHGQPQEKGSRAVALLLAIAAVLAAIVTARASLIASDAADQWQSAVAAEQRRGAILLEGVRYTYGVEGQLGLRVATDQAIAEALRAIGPAQSPDVAARVEREAQVHDQMVQLTGPSEDLISDPAYRLPGGGYDLQKRLADERRASPDDGADPADRIAAGDAAAERADRLMVVTVIIGGAFLLGALAQPLRRRRRLLLTLGWACLGASVVAALVAGFFP
ncbi:MAG: hypothetical protein U0869_19805 [Chloroflexota bacterium]